MIPSSALGLYSSELGSDLSKVTLLGSNIDVGLYGCESRALYHLIILPYFTL